VASVGRCGGKKKRAGEIFAGLEGRSRKGKDPADKQARTLLGNEMQMLDKRGWREREGHGVLIAPREAPT